MGYLLILTQTDIHEDFNYVIGRATSYKEAWEKAKKLLGESIDYPAHIAIGEKATHITIAKETTFISLQKDC